MKKAIIGIIGLAILAGAAYYISKSGLAKPPVNQPATVVPTSTQSESEILIAAVKQGLIAEHGQDAASLDVTISKIEGDFSKGMAGGQGGGGLWFAAKVNGTWKLVFDGNGIITCDILTPYPAFPKDLIPECWDTKTDNLIKR